ncbi:MAG: response regulator [Panacagrimonas sp.]|nr:response regulator [Panacagrimonas sp.]
MDDPVKSVLVVDDEFGIAEVLEALLVDAGFRVTRAINGLQGLQRLHESAVDLVMLDMMMPLMDGPTMLGKLRADPLHRATPVIVMSGLPRDVAESRISDAYQGYLQKPFMIQALFEAIETAFGREPD